MKWFKCSIAGENFPGDLVDDDKLVGFYVTRFVQAETTEDAEVLGLNSLRTEESLQLPEGVMPPPTAKVYFEEIVEIEESEVPSVPPGFTFFPMDS
jgi:hypothetical protein